MARKKSSNPTELPYTKRLKKEKEERMFWKGLGLEDEGETSYHFNHVDFRESNVTDDQLHLLVTRVKSVNMFDLNGTDISCEGIKALAKLESLNELRLKECNNISNDCIPVLNEIVSLKLLYVKSTPITVDGLLGLTNLTNLRELFFSGTPVENMEAKIRSLEALLPECKLIMDGKEIERPAKYDEY